MELKVSCMWCCFLVALVAIGHVHGQNTTFAATNTTAASTTGAPTSLPPNATNATKNNATDVRRHTRTLTLTPSWSIVAKANASNTTNATTTPAPTKRRYTRTRTVPITPAPPTTPPPTVNGDDFVNPSMTAVAAAVLTTAPLVFDPDAFRALVLSALIDTTLGPLYILVDYCGVNLTETSWTTSVSVCADRLDSSYTNTLVHFGFNNWNSSAFADTKIRWTSLPVATSSGSALRQILAYSALAFAPAATPSPGVISSVTSKATSSATSIVIALILIAIFVCLVALLVRHCILKRKKEEAERKEATVRRAARGDGRTAGAGDVYEMQDREDAAAAQQQPSDDDEKPVQSSPGAPPGSATVPAPRPSQQQQPAASSTSLFNSRPAWGQSNAGTAAAAPAPQPVPSGPVGGMYSQQPAPQQYGAATAAPTSYAPQQQPYTPSQQPPPPNYSAPPTQYSAPNQGYYGQPQTPTDAPPARQTTSQYAEPAKPDMLGPSH